MKRILLAGLMCVAIFFTLQAQTIRYVKRSSTGTGSGIHGQLSISPGQLLELASIHAVASVGYNAATAAGNSMVVRN